MMTNKEKIYAEIESISEEYFEELYWLIKRFADAKSITKKSTFMSKLKSIEIDAPEDFAANLDLYLSGEKNIEIDAPEDFPTKNYPLRGMQIKIPDDFDEPMNYL